MKKCSIESEGKMKPVDLSKVNQWILQVKVDEDWIKQITGTLKQCIDYWCEELKGYSVRFVAETVKDEKREYFVILETQNYQSKYPQVFDMRV